MCALPIWERGRKLARDRNTIGSNQGEVLTLLGQSKIRVKWRAGHATIFVGSKNNEKLAGGEIGRWKTPFGELGWIVSEAPVIQIEGARAAVVDFDPIGKLGIFVG